MKSVLISIQPKWCELIASGKKTVEVRKTKPKIETPFKCYIYETKDKHFENIGVHYADGSKDFIHHIGKVIGEFVCDKIDDFYCASIPYKKENNLGYGCFVDNGVYKVDGWFEGVVFERSGPRIDTMLKNTDLENMCLSAQEIFDYIGIGKHLYAWHISDLVIYDHPRELGEFEHTKEYVDKIRNSVVHWECGVDDVCVRPLKRPPQSWCYVEDVQHD